MSDTFDSFVTVNFKNYPKNYYFGVDDIDLKLGDYAVANTELGSELVKVVEDVRSTKDLPGDFKLKGIRRKATEKDINNYDRSEELAKDAMISIEKYISQLKLKMKPLSAKYSLDLKKVLIVYVAEERVDFRELLRLLNTELRVRIELKQIGERDKAKMVSGIATCGMETCCSRFMSEFEMISINMAKNQNLALNISKLSGLCGKFMCCLKHEDEVYSDVKKEWPAMNSQITYKGQKYYVNGMNYVAEEAKLVNKEETIYVNFNEAFYDFTKNQNEAKSNSEVVENKEEEKVKPKNNRRRNNRNKNRNNKNKKDNKENKNNKETASK